MNCMNHHRRIMWFIFLEFTVMNISIYLFCCYQSYGKRKLTHLVTQRKQIDFSIVLRLNHLPLAGTLQTISRRIGSTITAFSMRWFTISHTPLCQQVHHPSLSQVILYWCLQHRFYSFVAWHDPDLASLYCNERNNRLN